MRINREIRADKVRVITEDGKQLGVLFLRDAIAEAEKSGLDLVEISPNAKPPVCKITDYGKLKYQKTKKEKKSKKAQHQIKVKEIKLRPNIDRHDLNTKLKKIKGFLEKGYKVRLTCMFKGREILHVDLGKKLIKEIISEFEDVASIETPSKQVGKVLSTVIVPAVKGKKRQESKNG